LCGIECVSKRIGLVVDRLSRFACGPSETAGPSPTLPRISLSSLAALANFARLSLRKAAYVALGGTAMQEIRVRCGRDDKVEGSGTP
jgi:hypothetical protein